MKGLGLAFATVLCLWLAAGFQWSVGPYVGIAGVVPDYLLVTVGVLSLFGNRRSGTTIGFFAGLIQGALAGANMAAYVVSRSVAGFVAGWFNSLEFEANFVVSFFVVAAATIVGQLLLMFIAPPGELVPFLLVTIGSAMYNGVLAMPLYAVLRRVFDPPSR